MDETKYTNTTQFLTLYESKQVASRNPLIGKNQNSHPFQLENNQSISQLILAKPNTDLEKSTRNTFKKIKIQHLKNLKQVDEKYDQAKQEKPEIINKNIVSEQIERKYERKGCSMGNLDKYEAHQTKKEIFPEEKDRNLIAQLKFQLSSKCKECENLEEVNLNLFEQGKIKQANIEELHNKLQKLENQLADERNQKQTLEYELMEEKDQYLNLQAEYEKLEREYQEIRKEKMSIQEKKQQKNKIKQLEEEIEKLTRALELKGTRYNLLLEEMETVKVEKQEMNKFRFHEIGQKERIQIVKSNLSQIQNYKLLSREELEEKIILLEQILSEQNSQKLKLYAQLHDLVERHTKIVSENAILRKDLEKKEKEIKLFENEKEIHENMEKAKDERNLPLVIRSIEEKNFKKLKIKEEQYKFELEKSRKTTNQEISKLVKKYENETIISEKNLNYWKKETEHWRDQCQQLKDKLIQMGKEQYEVVSRLRKEYENKIGVKQIFERGEAVEEKYEKQIKIILERLQDVTRSNEKYAKQNGKLAFLQIQNMNLKQQLQKMRTISLGVDHLWQIKDVEYGNIRKILLQLQ